MDLSWREVYLDWAIENRDFLLCIVTGYLRRTPEQGAEDEIVDTVVARIVEKDRGWPLEAFRPKTLTALRNELNDRLEVRNRSNELARNYWQQLRGRLPRKEASLEDLLVQLRQAVSHLTAFQQQLLYLRFTEGRSLVSIATFLGISTSGVCSHLKVALHDLRHEFDALSN
jgi:RNA polymerase sigma factor (sigma-70 family)